MREFLLCFFIGGSAVIAGQPIPRAVSPVTVLLDFRQPHSTLSLDATKAQIDKEFEKTSIKVDIRDRSEVSPHAEFSQLLLFMMKGSCSMDVLPIDALSDERGPFAMAYSSDGRILPFGEVECDRVRLSLQRILGRTNSEKYQRVFGTALGMVLAHEVYHILTNNPGHTRSGVTKHSLSARELLEGELSLPEAAQLAVGQRLAAGPQ